MYENIKTRRARRGRDMRNHSTDLLIIIIIIAILLVIDIFTGTTIADTLVICISIYTSAFYVVRTLEAQTIVKDK